MLPEKELRLLSPGAVSSLYFCNEEDYDNFDLAEFVPGPSTHFQDLAAT
jgi:hypothetical protein